MRSLYWYYNKINNLSLVNFFNPYFYDICMQIGSLLNLFTNDAPSKHIIISLQSLHTEQIWPQNVSTLQTSSLARNLSQVGFQEQENQWNALWIRSGIDMAGSTRRNRRAACQYLIEREEINGPKCVCGSRRKGLLASLPPAIDGRMPLVFGLCRSV